MQALMLAAGLGKRLAKYTKDNTKCMVEVAGEKLIDRAITAIKKAGITRFVIVTGYKGDNLRKYILDNYEGQLDFVFIDNKDYATTNNIYSFYLAKEELKKDDVILLESDIIFDEDLIKDVLESEDKDIVTVAKYESWMDGTCVTLDENNCIKKFIEKARFLYEFIDKYYKTVNIYKFSKEFVNNIYIPFLEAYMKMYGLNCYYETPLKYICKLPEISFKAFTMDNRPWYEIDDAQDLDIATVLFSNGEGKLKLIEKKYGGYWRFPGHLDFCYLVNPYFPPKEMVAKLQYELPTLLTQYPSGLSVQNMNAGRLYNVDENHIYVGNGAAELINALGHISKGKKVAVNLPAFNEYVRCFKESEIIEIGNSKYDYQLKVEEIKKAIEKADITVVISPDNPSGFMLSKSEIVELAEFAKSKGHKLVVDESFADFARKEIRFTLLDDEFINKYSNVIVIKSISKSYGVPGLRLGLLATSDTELLKELKQEMQVWNINSFAEYYLQIYQLFAKSYYEACDKIVEAREEFVNKLKEFKEFKVYPSEANYVMIDTGKVDSHKLAMELLNKYKFIIKDLSSKHCFENKNFIRLAVRNNEDNDYLIKCLKEVIK